MNIKEAREKCYKHGIFQLNKGESLADALDHIDNGSARKGYKFKHDNGRPMSENQIIANENSIAFHKSFTPPVFKVDEVESIEDIAESMDFREDKGARGVIINCFYCGDCIRIDGDDFDDYAEPEDTIHCDSCMNAAISRLAM